MPVDQQEYSKKKSSNPSPIPQQGRENYNHHQSNGNSLKYSVTVCSHLQINAFDCIFILFV